eukprot:COSAG01_NODE_15668_length_1312_cov_2.087387_1_plen_33_part_10
MASGETQDVVLEKAEQEEQEKEESRGVGRLLVI